MKFQNRQDSLDERRTRDIYHTCSVPRISDPGFLYDGDYFRNKISSLYKKLVEFSFQQDVQKADP